MDNLLLELKRDRDLMKIASSEVKTRGIEYARAEAEYQSAKARRALEMKADGCPVTFIQTVIKGDEEVCEKMFQRDCAEAEYKSAVEALNVYKLDSRLLEAQISREWGENDSL